MKVPKSFRPNKELEEKIAQLAEGSFRLERANHITMSNLLKTFQKFVYVSNEKVLTIDQSYIFGEKLANKLDYTKHDLEEVSSWIKVNNFGETYQGIYLSALVNKIIKEDEEIIIRPINLLSCVGTCLKKGKIIVEDNTDSFTGHRMMGGELHIKGDCGVSVGNQMKGGKIIVQGYLDRDVGPAMEGGEIVGYGGIEYISKSCKGKIFNGKTQIWPHN
ncbi:MAG: hypothetical protein KKA79_05595 [Nanoarchaeota archaeon]|nr:hypothetical protein [Nanoarchaeota archaeon]MCG2717757.1 hypothetical protein [Nanoarchaeota archaeon]